MTNPAGRFRAALLAFDGQGLGLPIQPHPFRSMHHSLLTSGVAKELGTPGSLTSWGRDLVRTAESGRSVLFMTT